MERDFAASESCKLSMNVLNKQASTDEILINFCSTYIHVNKDGISIICDTM